MEQERLGILGLWRNDLELLKYFWLFFGYIEHSRPFSIKIVSLANVCAVLRGRVLVILLYRLPNVKMVSASEGQRALSQPR